MEREILHVQMRYAGQLASVSWDQSGSNWLVLIETEDPLDVRRENALIFSSPDMENACSEAGLVLKAREVYRERIIDAADHFRQKLADILGDRAPGRESLGPWPLTTEQPEAVTV